MDYNRQILNVSVTMNHYAIFCTNNTNASLFIQKLHEGKYINAFPSLNINNAVVYSPALIKEFIEEEAKRDYTILNRADKRMIRTFSSGEQKRIVLEYLLSKQPAYIILDNPFDNLDLEHQKKLLEKISEAAHTISIIQVIYRKKDRLPFITTGFQLCQDYQLIPIKNIDVFVDQPSPAVFFKPVIPGPIHTYNHIPDKLVQLHDVTIAYNEQVVLNKINWIIQKNEFWQLKGANGSGKTTLLTMITGDSIKGYGQELYLFGKKKGSGESVWEIKDKIGYVTPAMTDLFNTRHTVEEMIVSGFYDSIGLYVIPSEIALQLSNEWLELLDMQPIKQKIFCQLPLGLQRKILIARAMVKHPPLLILDEPAYGLDDENTEMIVDLINKLSKESNTTIVYVSHREEKNLQPQYVFELAKTENGSAGRVVQL